MNKYFSFLCLVFMGVAVACQNSSERGEEPFVFPQADPPDRQWNVALLVMEGVYNTELTAPMDILHHTVFHTPLGMKVFTVAKTREPLRSFEGLHLTPDFSYLDDSLPEIDVLVVPSAEHHLDTDLQDQQLLEFVRAADAQASYVMSLCDGAFVLAAAGLLDGRLCTTFPGDIAVFRERFPHLDVQGDAFLVHDGKYITSAGGARSFEPALYLVELLYGKKAADGVAKGMVIDWRVQEGTRLKVAGSPSR